jgi:N-acetylmuramoyl-L-alanine amidase
VSAHYLINTDGTVLSLVSEGARAWHAGAGAWRGEADVNSRSIGIELANTGREPFADQQMAALEQLLGGVLTRHRVSPQAVIGHSDMAPDRKADPGPRFDWRRLALQGLSVWPDPGEPGDFFADLKSFGYPDAPLDTLLAAFRLRFRPWATGPLDDTDRSLAAGLRRFPG